MSRTREEVLREFAFGLAPQGFVSNIAAQKMADAILTRDARIAALEAEVARVTANQQTGEPVAWEAKYKAAREVISELCDGKRRWTMSVPARPDHDPDLVICDALDTMRLALLGTTEGHRNNVAAVKWIAQQFCDEFGNPKADMPKWAHDITDILILGEKPVAHPRPRVGVTEELVSNAIRETNGRDDVEWASEIADYINSALAVAPAPTAEEDEEELALQRQADNDAQSLGAFLREMGFQPLEESPAPTASGEGVVELDEWRAVYANGETGFTSTDRAEVEILAQEDNERVPGCGARVMRVCLHPLANGGGEVARG